MVSKVAVMALVALVAFPIGLGYALNFHDVEYTDYIAGKDINVTNLLQNGQVFTYADANSYQLNGPQFSFDLAPRERIHSNKGIYPNYNQFSSAQSSIRFYADNVNGVGDLIYYLNYLQGFTGVDSSDRSLQLEATFTVANTDNTTRTNVIPNLLWYYMNGTPTTDNYGRTVANFTIAYMGSGGADRYVNPTILVISKVTGISIQTTANYHGTPERYYLDRYNNGSTSPDITQGFSISNNTGVGGSGPITYNYGAPSINRWISPGSGAKNILMTMDLSTVENTFYIGQYINSYGIQEESGYYDYLAALYNCIQVTNTASVHQIAGQDMLYTDGKPNVYQLQLTDTEVNIYYCGNTWPNSIGKANYYRSWTVAYSDLPTVNTWDSTYSLIPYPITYTGSYDLTDEDYINSLTFSSYPLNNQNNFSIGKIRMDAAYIKSAPISAIRDYDYNPTSITGTDNVRTTLAGISMCGTSIGFGGNTYAVNKTSIRIGSTWVPLDGVIFDSVYDEDSQRYENKINGTVISTTVSPSNISFNGPWQSIVNTAPLTAETSTVSKWIPGQWTWNGLDMNFAIIGLVTCIGVFIGLGIYGQRSGGKVGTLMLVCAGGALVFLALL